MTSGESCLHTRNRWSLELGVNNPPERYSTTSFWDSKLKNPPAASSRLQEVITAGLGCDK